MKVNISLHLDEDAFVTCEEASAASFKDRGSNVRHVLRHHQPELTRRSSEKHGRPSSPTGL